MYLITLLAQLISNLRAKYTVLRLRQFFSPSTYPINSILTVAVRIYKIYVFNEVYFLSEATVATITKRVFFFPFFMTAIAGTHFLSQSCCLSIQISPENAAIITFLDFFICHIPKWIWFV